MIRTRHADFLCLQCHAFMAEAGGGRQLTSRTRDMHLADNSLLNVNDIARLSAKLAIFSESEPALLHSPLSGSHSLPSIRSPY